MGVGVLIVFITGRVEPSPDPVLLHRNAAFSDDRGTFYAGRGNGDSRPVVAFLWSLEFILWNNFLKARLVFGKRTYTSFGDVSK